MLEEFEVQNKHHFCRLSIHSTSLQKWTEYIRNNFDKIYEVKLFLDRHHELTLKLQIT